MKRHSSILLLLCIIPGSLTGCGKALPKNYIATKTLANDQKHIVDLVSNPDHSYIFFDIKTEEEFKDMKFWMDIYRTESLLTPPL